MDIKEKDTIQAQGHEVPDKGVVLYKSLSNNLFSGSRKMYFIYAKAEKLASAIYLVTELLPEQNPLKKRLRSAAVGLIPASLDFIIAVRSRIATDVRRQAALARTQEILSLCRVALALPGASRMNFSILEREYESLLNETAVLSPLEASEDVLSKETLAVGSIPPDAAPRFFAASRRAFGSAGAIKDAPAPRRGVSHAAAYRPTASAGDVLDGQSKGQGQSNREGRKETILKVIGEKGSVGIKEIARGVAGCSEKTIQRLIADLVSEGVLKKEGERRWSQYRLASRANF